MFAFALVFFAAFFLENHVRTSQHARTAFGITHGTAHVSWQVHRFFFLIPKIHDPKLRRFKILPTIHLLFLRRITYLGD